jgi:hypothetical protein
MAKAGMIVAEPVLRGRDSPPVRRGIRGALRCPGDETEDGLTTGGLRAPGEKTDGRDDDGSRRGDPVEGSDRIPARVTGRFGVVLT